MVMFIEMLPAVPTAVALELVLPAPLLAVLSSAVRLRGVAAVF